MDIKPIPKTQTQLFLGINVWLDIYSKTKKNKLTTMSSKGTGAGSLDLNFSLIYFLNIYKKTSVINEIIKVAILVDLIFLKISIKL